MRGRQQPAASVCSPPPLCSNLMEPSGKSPLGSISGRRWKPYSSPACPSDLLGALLRQMRPEGGIMFKIAMLATAAVIVAAPVFAQGSKIALGEGEAVMISPDGTVHKSNTKVSGAKHEAALAKGANEISRGTVFYRHE